MTTVGVKTLLYTSAIVVLSALPFLVGSYWISVFIMIFLYAYLGLAWNILGGFAGQLSIGHSLYLGIGAYTSTLLLTNFQLTPLIGILLGAVTTTLVAVCIGYLCFRYGLKGHYFALSTIAFAEIGRIGVLNLKFLGGAKGLLLPFHRGNSFYHLQFSDPTFYYFIVFVLMIAGFVVNYAVRQSKLGYYLLAIREDEAAAEALGIDAYKYKLMALALSSFMTAMGGTFIAQYFMYIQPDFIMSLPQSIEILIRPIIGGSGTIWGPVIGAFILGPLQEITRAFFAGYAGLHLMAYGIIIVLVMLFLPEGVLGGLTRLTQRRKDIEGN